MRRAFFSLYLCFLTVTAFAESVLVNDVRIFNGVDAKPTTGNVLVVDGIIDTISSDLCFRLLDAGNAGSGPVDFQDGTPASGLTYMYASLGSTIDDIDFSNDGGLTFSYTPVDNGAGCDPSVTDIRVNPQGVLAADTGGGPPGFELVFYATVN